LQRTQVYLSEYSLQKAHKAFERGEVLHQIVEVPAHKIIVLDEDGNPRDRNIANRPSALNTSAVQNRNDKEDNGRAIKQETIDVERQTINRDALKRRRTNSPMGSLIKQGIIDLEDPGAHYGALVPADTIKHDLTELDSPFAKKIKLEGDAGVVSAPNESNDPAHIKLEASASEEYVNQEEGFNFDPVRIKVEQDDDTDAAHIKLEGGSENGQRQIENGDKETADDFFLDLEIPTTSDEFIMSEEDYKTMWKPTEENTAVGDRDD
jgi:hypothetical protein